MSKNNPQEPEDNEDSSAESAGLEDVLFALGDVLRHEKTKDALASLIEKSAENLPSREKSGRRMLLLGHSITAFVIVAVSILGYLKVISSETTGVILAAIVGHLYRDRRN